ncbi:MAG: patatin-like phospholipase domain-containing protein [Thermoanaerobaculia bacterium]|nr:patatin-like phospholipase domain-containing protein [Thermoanaerobaculia bacterium]
MPALLDELLALRAGGGPLAALSAEDLAQLASETVEIRCAAGELLLRAGEEGDDVYVALAGALEAFVPAAAGGEAQRLAAIGPGELVGEVVLIVGGSRQASVRAVADSRLARLTRASFDRLLERSPETWRHVTDLVLARLRRRELMPHLEALFGPFAPEEGETLRRLADSVEHRTLRRGEELFRLGDAADAAYVVLDGALRAAVPDAERGEREVAEFRRGRTVGDLALVSGAARTATVYAVRDSDLARIPRAAFLELIERRPTAALKVAQSIVVAATRRDAAAERRRSAGGTLGLLAGGPSAPVEEIARELAARLAPHGGARLVTSDDVDAALGRHGIAQAAESEPTHLRLTQWLFEQEQRHRHLILVADPTWTRWSERCARSTDQLVTIADATQPAAPGELEARLTSSLLPGRDPRRSLVLVHPAATERPRETSRWLRERNVDDVYHLRRGDEAGLGRLARLLGGRAVSLVLGGGGARGFAHLGVFRALAELGVPVDRVGGASIGAAMALPVALGFDPERSLAHVREGFSSLLDYTLPLASLLAGRRITRAIERHAAGWEIEDLWIPYFCVSTNLTTARSVVHRRGEVVRAVRASVSIPGVLPPVPADGDLLVDGGVLDNLPIGVAREIDPHGTIVAIDVAPPRGPAAKRDYGNAISGWRLARDRVLPWRRAAPVPGIGVTILQSQVVAASRARQQLLDQGVADLYLNIHVKGVGLLAFDQVDRGARVGYDESIGPLRDWAAARPASP